MYDIPLPKVVGDVGPGGPFVTQAKAMNELRKLQAEAQFAPFTEYANALSKTAYGQYAPANAIATFMNSPAANNLNKEQIAALTTQMQNALKQPNMVSSIPSPQGGGIFGNSLVGEAFNALMNLVTPKSNAINQQPNINNQQAQPATAQQNIAPTIQEPANISPASSNVPGGIMPANQLFGTNSYGRQAANAGTPGSVGGINPMSGARATESGLTAGVTAEAQNEVNRMDKMITNDNLAAEAVPNTQIILDKAKDARGRLPAFQKGRLFGHTPAMTTAANDYDAAMATLVTQWAKADSQGNLTNMGRDLAAQAKAPRNVSDEAFDHMYEYTSGLQDRILEKPSFNTTFKNAGYTSTQIPILWNYYQTKRPFYDSKSHLKDDNNINSWEEFYLNPKNLNAAFSPKAQKEINKFINAKPSEVSNVRSKNSSNKTTQYVKLGDTTYHYQNGEYWQ